MGEGIHGSSPRSCKHTQQPLVRSSACTSTLTWPCSSSTCFTRLHAYVHNQAQQTATPAMLMMLRQPPYSNRMPSLQAAHLQPAA